MDARSNVSLRAIALRGDIAEIEEEGMESIEDGEKPAGVCPCRLALARLSYVKPQLAALRRRCGGGIPTEVQEASKALGKAEKRLAFRCGRRGLRYDRSEVREVEA